MVVLIGYPKAAYIFQTVPQCDHQTLGADESLSDEMKWPSQHLLQEMITLISI